MTDGRRETEPALDPVLSDRFAALQVIEVPEVWADATGRGRETASERPHVTVAIAPIRIRRTRPAAPWLASVAAVAGLIAVIALIAAVRRPVTEPQAVLPTTTMPALGIATVGASTVAGVTTIDLELTFDAAGEELLPNAVYVVREGASFPEAVEFTGCLAQDDLQTKLIQPAYAIDTGVTEATECGFGSILLRPGDRSALTITTRVLPTGVYRVALGGWSSAPFEVVAADPTPTDPTPTSAVAPAPVEFTALSLMELPDGYTFVSATRDRSGDPQVGMARFVGPAGAPDLVLISRAIPDFFENPIELGRMTWPVNGRTVVNDGEGDGSCLPDTCSVGVQWDETTAVSVTWSASEESGAELGPDHTLESLVVIAATLIEVEPTFYIAGSIAPADGA